MAMLRLPALKAETGKGRSTLYSDIQRGLLTRPVPIGIRAVGWPESEIHAINAARISGKTDAEIQQLVKRLEAARKEAV
jgi:prophage regulatory protein